MADHETSPEQEASIQSPFHSLLLLSDSAMPLGSFAFSSGLESYLAHQAPRSSVSLSSFLSRSLLSLASSSLPFVFASHRSPVSVSSLDTEQESSLLCNVTRRASISQGRALLALWERSFKSVAEKTHPTIDALSRLSKSMRSQESCLYQPNGHFAPIWGAVTAALGLTKADSAFVFLYNHVKSVLSAAVRANILGPYQAQKILAEGWIRQEIQSAIRKFWATSVEDAGQGWPPVDLWLGRHELLYSRIFNS